jgi:hypothetical protein
LQCSLSQSARETGLIARWMMSLQVRVVLRRELVDDRRARLPFCGVARREVP